MFDKKKNIQVFVARTCHFEQEKFLNQLQIFSIYLCQHLI